MMLPVNVELLSPYLDLPPNSMAVRLNGKDQSYKLNLQIGVHGKITMSNKTMVAHIEHGKRAMQFSLTKAKAEMFVKFLYVLMFTGQTGQPF